MDEGADLGRPARRRASGARAMWGLSRTLVNNMVDGVTKGFEQQARDHRRRLSRGRAGQEPAAAARLQPRRGLSDPGRASRSRRPKPTEIVISGIDKQQVGQVAAEIRGYPSAGALQGQGREVCRRTYPPQGRQEEVRAWPWQRKITHRAPHGARPHARSRRRQWPSAPVGLPFVEEHLRPGHRRRAGRDSGGRLVAGKGRERADKKGADNDAAHASASWSPSAPSRRASRTSSSTAAATYHGRVKALADAAREAGLNF